ncbi:MAG TPA: PAS domain S-box protein [Thermoplasmatales archaeon]|nr:PAS domain S-box protein [Thermoplasmatales archaeon]
MRYHFQGFTRPTRLHVGEVCMRDEPEIVKELREAEKLRLLQGKIQTTYENLETKEQLSRGTQAEVTVFDERSRWKDVTEDIPFESSVKNLYKSIVELSPDGIVTVDLKGIVTSCNTAAMKMFGFSKDEIVGKPFTEIGVFKEKDIEKYLELFDSILVDEGGGALEIEFQRKDGSSFTGEVRIGLIKENEETVGFQAIIRDVTEQRKAEEKLRESEERFRDLLETANDLIQSVDEKGRFIYVNRRWLETLGYSDEEVRKMTLFDILRKDHIPHCMEIFERVKNGESVEGVETVFVTKDGREIVVEGNVNGRFKDGRFISCRGIFRDITERKKMEEELKESKSHFQMLFNLVADPVVVVDSRGKFLEVTDKVEEITGFKKEELIGKSFLKTRIVTPKSKEVLLKNLAGRITGGEIKPYEIEVVTKDGKKIPFEVNAAKITYKGKPADMVVFRDITERKKMEEELRELKQRFEDVALSSADFIWEVDRNGRYTYASGGVKQILGYSPGELVGKTPFDLMPENEAERIKRIFEKIVSEKKPIVDLENWNLTKDGKRVCLLTNGVPILDEKGNFLGYRGVDKDITERKQMEEELMKAYVQVENLLNAAADGIRIVNRDFTVKTLNDTMAELAGVKKEEGIGMKCNEMFGSDVCGTKNCSMRRILREGRKIQVETLRRRLDGKTVPCLHVATPLRDSDGNIIGIIEDFRDITEQKKVEEKLRKTHHALVKMNETLEQKVKERTVEVEKLLRQKDDFIRQLGHDLKTPLTPLNALLPIVRERVDDPKLKELLDVSIRNVAYMKNLVTKTLQLARLNAPSELDFEDTNLLEEVNAVIANNQTNLEERNIRVERMIDDGIVVKADRLRLGELFDNLISNAVKYSPNGGIVTIGAKEENGVVTVFIKDSGIGMTKEQMSHVFDEFYKADESRHDFDSSGLGLSICKRIVEKHGGRIWVESQGLGKGSTFYFTLKAGGREKINKHAKLCVEGG